MTKQKISTCTCWVTTEEIDENTLIVKSSFLKQPIEVRRMQEDSEFYLGSKNKENAYVVQLQFGKPVSFTHTSYDKNGELIYGVSGEGVFIKECGLLR